MVKLNASARRILTVALLSGATITTAAFASPPTNLTPTLVVAAEIRQAANVGSNGVQLTTDARKDTAITKLEYAGNSSSGWHHHPGVVLVQVLSGRVKVWGPACGYKVYEAGQTFLENDKVHKITSRDGAVLYGTTIVVDGQPPRIEDPVPLCDQ